MGGTVKSKQDALDFLTWTYFYRRLLQNPAYYAAGSASGSDVGAFASELIETTLDDLACAGCVEISADDDLGVSPTTLGRIASYYYLSHQTVALFSAELAGDEGPTALPTLLRVLCAASEYAELPVRHNEEHVNEQMAQGLPWAVDESQFESPHVKAALLLQATCPPTRAVSFAPLGAASCRPLIGSVTPSVAGALRTRSDADERLRDRPQVRPRPGSNPAVIQQ